jgi:acetylornithine deacetylase
VSELEELICDLVAIESVNPDLVRTGGGETAIAKFVASWLLDAGLRVEVIEPLPGRPSVVGILRGSGGGKSLMLNAHMDTVGAGGMSNPFEPELRGGHGGRIYGRGAYDMKASLAAIMLSAREAGKHALKGDLIVAAVSDEEVASAGTSSLLERFHADAAIVTEPTELGLCLAHKGFVWLEVETAGVAAHGSRADIGVDAIAAMGTLLTGVGELEARLEAGPGHALLGPGSIHMSLIAGGQEMSTYPARCLAQLERRTIPGEDAASSLREIEELITGSTASVKVVLERQPSEVPRDSPIADAVYAAAGRPEVVGVAYWMDMALLNAAGIPAVAFGPSGEGAHADVEWVDVRSVERCVEVYQRAAQLICR